MTGHLGDLAGARRALGDPAGEVRATALGALLRLGNFRISDVTVGLSDPDPGVRRRTCELAAASPALAAETIGPIQHRLADTDVTVAEVAAWALGELAAEPASVGLAAPIVANVVRSLSAVAISHIDPLCREAAVASLGAIGHDDGLAAILHGGGDKPAIRRRAVLALAPFEGAAVDAALRAALHDRDWQVRAAAEDLLDLPPGAGDLAVGPDEKNP